MTRKPSAADLAWLIGRSGLSLKDLLNDVSIWDLDPAETDTYVRLVTFVKDAGKPGPGPEPEPTEPRIPSGNIGEVYATVCETPGLTGKEILETLLRRGVNIKNRHVSPNLSNLRKQGLLRSERQAGERLYRWYPRC